MEDHDGLKLYLNEKVDYEQQSDYDLKVIVNGMTYHYDIQVVDENDNSPVFDKESLVVTVVETNVLTDVGVCTVDVVVDVVTGDDVCVVVTVVGGVGVLTVVVVRVTLVVTTCI